MRVIGLVDPETGVEERSPDSEAEAEHEQLVHPAGLEEFSHESPASFDHWIGIPLANDLRLSS